jgi:hypothetical protein
VQVMARREVTGGRLDSARNLVAELEGVPEDLASALRALEARRAIEVGSVQEVQRLTHEHDPTVGERERGRVLYGAAISWLVVCVAFAVLELTSLFHAGPGAFALYMGAAAAGAIGQALLHPDFSATSAARAFALSIIATNLGLCAIYTLGWLQNVDVTTTIAAAHIVFAVGIFATSAFDARVWRGVPVAAAGAPAVLLVERFAHAGVYVVTGLCACAALVLVSPIVTGTRAQPARQSNVG